MEVEKINAQVDELTLFEGLQREDLVYVYRGAFSQVISDSIIALTENNLDSVGESSKLKKRVFSIMVECLQNITRHQFVPGCEKLEGDKSGMFVICNKNKSYQMTSGNVISNDTVPHLKTLLEKVNSLNKDELKLYYKQVLEDGSISSKGGAGLGLIEMARKSGNKLFFTFEKIDENLSYFYMNTSISQQLEEAPVDSIDIQDIVTLHKFVLQKDIMLIFNGGLNQKSMVEILSLVNEQSFGHLERKKKLFNVVVEILQNVVKHGVKQNENANNGNPVIFYISQEKNSFVLNAGNYINRIDLVKLEKEITYLNSLNKEELEDVYTKCLLNFEIDSNKEAGLGLIDMRIKSGHKIKYELTPIDDTVSFILMQITI